MRQISVPDTDAWSNCANTAIVWHGEMRNTGQVCFVVVRGTLLLLSCCRVLHTFLVGGACIATLSPSITRFSSHILNKTSKIYWARTTMIELPTYHQ